MKMNNSIANNQYNGSLILGKTKKGTPLVYHKTYEGEMDRASRLKFMWRLFSAENGTMEKVRASGFGAAEYARRLLRGAPENRQEEYARRIEEAGMLTGEVACKILLAGKVTNEKALEVLFKAVPEERRMEVVLIGGLPYARLIAEAGMLTGEIACKLLLDGEVADEKDVAMFFEAVPEERRMEVVLMGRGPKYARLEEYIKISTGDEMRAYSKLLLENAEKMTPDAQERLASAIHAAAYFTPYSWDGKPLKAALRGLPIREKIEANGALCGKAKEWMLDLADLQRHISKVMTAREERKKRMRLELQVENGRCGTRCNEARELLEGMGLAFDEKMFVVRKETNANMELLYYTGFLDDETREELENLKMKNNVQPTAEFLKFRHGTDAPYPILKITLPGKAIVLENFNEQEWRQRLQEIISGK